MAKKGVKKLDFQTWFQYVISKLTCYLLLVAKGTLLQGEIILLQKSLSALLVVWDVMLSWNWERGLFLMNLQTSIIKDILNQLASSHSILIAEYEESKIKGCCPLNQEYFGET